MLLYDLSFVLMYVTAVSVLMCLARGFFRGAVNGFYFLIPVFVLTYIFPSLVDFLTGSGFQGASYSSYAYQALTDHHTTMIYNVYVSAILIVFYMASRFRRAEGQAFSSEQVVALMSFVRRWRIVIWFFALFPVMLVLASGDIGWYSEYAGRDRVNASDLQVFATKAVVVSMPLIAFYIAENMHRFKNGRNVVCLFSIVFLVLIAIVNSYIHGKRSVVAIFIFFLALSFFVTKVISRRSLAAAIVGLTVFFVFFLFAYGKNIDAGDGVLGIMQGMRVDFSRDYSLKFVIYNELLNDNKVLPFKGASYLFLLTFFVPRFIWLDKPYPYAVYFTNSFFGNFGGDYLYGWGLTTSFVTEAVSNLGWAGLLLFPVFYIYSLKKIDRLNRLGVKIVGYIVMILLLVIQPIAIFPLISIFFILIFLRKKIVIRGSR